MNFHVATGLIQAGTAGAAVSRGFHLNLAKEYRALFSFLLFIAVNEFVLALIPTSTFLYFWLYIAFSLIRCVLGVLAVRELVSLTLVDYPGIRTLVRWAIFGATGLAMAVSLALTGISWHGSAPGRAHSHLFFVELVKRSVILTLAAVIIIFLLFISKYPLDLAENTIVTSIFFSAIFLSEALRLLLDSFTRLLHNAPIDWAQSFFVSGCLIGWTFRLLQSEKPIRSRIRFADPQEEHLLAQLTTLNRIMTRSIRQ